MIQEHPLTPMSEQPAVKLKLEELADTSASIKAEDSTPIDVKKDVLELSSISSFSPQKAHEQLNRILEKISPVDFKKQANINDNTAVTISQYRVITIKELLDIVRKQDYGLSRMDEMTYVYNGAYWAMLRNKEIESFLGAVAMKMGVPTLIAEDYMFRDALFKQFDSAAQISEAKQDSQKILINLMNGTFEVDPEGYRLRTFEPKDYMRYQLPFSYDESATAPRFIKFLEEVLPDPSSQKVLAEFCGYIFIQHLRLDKVLLLKGEGANGKSVFFEVLTALLGQHNCGNYSLYSLTNPANGYARAMLQNKLVNYASEISGHVDIGIFKQLAAGENVEARLPYEHPFILKQIPKMIFNVNELPRKVEQTHAYFRRFLIIPFEVTIPPERQDKELAKIIIASELAGVFNWVLQGLSRLLEQKDFSLCVASNKIVEAYKRETDTVAGFMHEKGYKPSTTKYVMRPALYAEYKAFCITDGYHAVSNSNFGKRLENAKYHLELKKDGWRIYAEDESVDTGSTKTPKG
jgi:putative DNA primase/helicase